VTGLDLIQAMLRIADGEPLPFRQEEIALKGHAIEVRINAEDPAKNFLPFPGTVTTLRVPGGPGVRFDTLLYPGYAIPPFYDSLLGKLIVWAEDRPRALARLKRALDELSIEGVKTTAPLFQALLEAEDVRQGAVHTRWLEGWLAQPQGEAGRREARGR
jgi:acetyl-CoA carboxylase biotin carboxylase subunit